MDCPNCGVKLKNYIEIDPGAELPENPFDNSGEGDYGEENANLHCGYNYCLKEMAGWVKKK